MSEVFYGGLRNGKSELIRILMDKGCTQENAEESFSDAMREFAIPPERRNKEELKQYGVCIGWGRMDVVAKMVDPKPTLKDGDVCDICGVLFIFRGFVSGGNGSFERVKVRKLKPINGGFLEIDE